MRVRVIVVALLAAALAAPSGAAGAPARARAFASCAQLDGYARRYAQRPGAIGVLTPAAGEVNAPTAAPTQQPDFSQTNVQEPGIDEPDVVKTDGTRVYAVAGGSLHVIAARATPAPRLLGSLKLDGSDQQLLLHGDRLLVIAREIAPIAVEPVQPAPPIAVIPFGPQHTILTEVDVSDPSAPRVVHTLTVEGGFVDAREHGATARVVIASPPFFTRPGVAAYRPQAVLRTARTNAVRSRPLVPCSSVRRPVSFSGVGTLTVLTIDLDRGLPPVDVDALMTSGETVYASPDRLYVATERWIAPDARAPEVPAGRATTVHAFDVTDPEKTTYVASGDVRGFVVDRFALSADHGHLRVATTDLPDWVEGDSESFVTVLDEQGGRLVAVGRVGGLGRGQRIFSVRYAGDRAYVVTFRQIDPLYTVDLSDPANPRVAGQLELLGYSAYLHPLGGDLLLGVGQDATPEGRRAGAQVSLFDVSDPSAPRRLDHVSLGADASALTEFDPHAFLYWPATRLAVVPTTTDAIGLRVSRRLDEVGRVTLPEGTAARALVVGDRLLTLSDAGLETSDLDTLQRRAWLPLTTG